MAKEMASNPNVTSIVNDLLVTLSPLSNSGTKRKIARCEFSAIACLVLLIAGARSGSAIYAATFSTARIITDCAREFEAISSAVARSPFAINLNFA